MQYSSKIYASIVAVIIALSFCGCSDTNQNTNRPTERTYDLNTDDQYCFEKATASEPAMCESESGYYFLNGFNDSFLIYMDKATLKSAILCNKPDCLHSNEPDPRKIPNCNAFLGLANANMMYYDSNLYILDESPEAPESGIHLYKVSLDGTTRKMIYTFKDMVSYIMIHRGSLYYVTCDNMSGQAANLKTKLFKLSLTDLSKAPELIYENDGFNSNIARLTGYGDEVFFVCTSYQDSKMEVRTGKIVSYNLLTDTLKEITQDCDYFSICRNSMVCTGIDSRMYACGLDGSNKKEIGIVSGITYNDDRFILVDTLLSKLKARISNDAGVKRELIVYSSDYQKIASFDINEFGDQSLYGSDGKYIFIQDTGARQNQFGPIKCLYVIDKPKLTDGSASLDKVFEFAPSVEYKGFITTNK